ncbi:hypothetical protein AAGW05_14710 [Arthrobacter sp. LAPM80]|uniref:hypothetical protein n=1 Tax=Arthrobacter sp. LAPM80 TaxID=3141788 RepID=UPI00398A6B25
MAANRAEKMTTIVDLDTRQILGVVDGRDHTGVGAQRMVLLRAADSLSEPAKARSEKVFTSDDPTGKLKAARDVTDQVGTLLRTGSLENAELAKDHLEKLAKESNQQQTRQKEPAAASSIAPNTRLVICSRLPPEQR